MNETPNTNKRPTPITDADERNYPQPEYLQLIQFEGCTMGVIDPEGYAELYEKSRDLERQLAEAREENARFNKALSNASAIYDSAREKIEEMETRHAATMLHTQTIVDDANEAREQRDRLAEALSEWPRLREWLEMDSFIRGYMSAELSAFDAMSNAVKGGQQ